MVPAIPTYLDLGYDASSDFEAVMSREGARKVLLFGTNFAYLIRNVPTGYVSPPFHILFDEEINTVTADNINVTDALWESFKFTYTSYLPDKDDPLLVLQQETIPPPPFSPQGTSQAPQGASQAP